MEASCGWAPSASHRAFANDPNLLPQGFKTTLKRREFLSGSVLLASGIAISGLAMIGCRAADEHPGDGSLAGGHLLDTVDFAGESGVQMDTPLEAELDGRLFFDLSALSAGEMVTPTDKFYIRTRASELLDLKRPWSIKLGGAKRPALVSAGELIETAEPVGLHLMECAGNARGGNFGLISVADWEGVQISKMLDRVGIKNGRSRVLISGFDSYSSPSATSIPGASWVFSADELSKSGAFIATKMNRSALTPDHGAPVRLVVPGWYGCCCIKWVNEITSVDEDTAATSQMREYATRTHQNGIPDFARDYEPAMIDPSAVPIRIERWKVNKRIRYKIIGIQWGGTQPAKSLLISFDGGAEWHAVDKLYERAGDSWALWEHVWSPKNAGKYRIRLKVGDPTVRTRRLDKGYYDRAINIPSN